MDVVARRSVVALVAVAIVASAGILWSSKDPIATFQGARTRGVETSANPGIRGIEALFDSSQPLFVDTPEATSYSEAISKADFTVATPQTLPPGVQRTEVWYSDSSGEVAMRYGDTLVIEYVPWVADNSPAAEYANMVKQYGAGKATTVAGQPAWVVPAGSAGEDQPPVAEVHVAVNGVEVTLYGKMSIDELVAVANSLSPTGKVATGITK